MIALLKKLLMASFFLAFTPLQAQIEDEKETTDTVGFSTVYFSVLPEIGFGLSPLSFPSYHPTLSAGGTYRPLHLFVGAGAGIDYNTGFDKVSFPIFVHLRWDFSASRMLEFADLRSEGIPSEYDHFFLETQMGVRIGTDNTPYGSLGLGYCYRGWQPLEKILPIRWSIGVARLDGAVLETKPVTRGVTLDGVKLKNYPEALAQIKTTSQKKQIILYMKISLELF